MASTAARREAAPTTLPAARWRDQKARAAPVFTLVPERKESPTTTRDRLWLVDAGGRRLLDLLPRLQVSYHRHGRYRQPAPRTRWLVFGGLTLRRLAGGGWTARAQAKNRWATHTLVLRGALKDPRVQLGWEVRYHRDLLVGLERLRFTPDDVRGSMLDRAYRSLPLLARQFSGRLSPRQVQLLMERGPGVPGVFLTLVGEAGVQGLYVSHRTGKAYSLDLELDHHLNHPFWRYRACVKKREERVGRRRMSFGQRRAGETRSLRATWVVGPARLAAISRYPRGYGAAVVLVDHADQSSAAKLEALAFGRTGAVEGKQTGPGHPGLVNRGLAYTKTIFVQRAGPHARQMEDPRYRRLLLRMAGQGVEIGVHSPTGRRDLPATGRRLLDGFRASFSGRTWVDHQPNTNCEAIGNQGWDPRGPWYMLGHLSELGFRYAWSGQDRYLPWGSLNLLSPETRARRRPVLYQHSRLRHKSGAPLTFFTTAWGFVHVKRLQRYLSPRWLKRLVNERGLFLAHVYLDAHRNKEDKPWLQRRSLLRALGRGRYELLPEVDRAFAGLAGWQARGDVWVAGLEAVAGHLLAAMDARLSHLPQGQVLVTSPVKRPLRGFTLLLPPGAASATVDGEAPAGSRRRGGVLEVWFDLHPGKPRLVQVLDRAGRPLEMLKPARIQIGR